MSQLALVLTLAFILFLFRRKPEQRVKVSTALWLPLIWFVVAGSRPLGDWFGFTEPEDTTAGSPLDAAIYFSLSVLGCYVLKKRQVTFAQFFRNNRWLTIFLLYCLVSVLWSQFPAIAFKRWIKVIGNVIMALVVLTDSDPQEAIRSLLKRIAYLMVPLSILLIIWYPDFAQGYDLQTGIWSCVGVTDNKNTLGHVCMILGLFFYWNTLIVLRRENPRARPGELFWSVIFLGMVCWLLWMSNSSTSKASMFVGILMLILLGLRSVNKRFIGTYLLIGLTGLVAANMVFGFYGSLVQSLGRDVTFTGRTDLWQALLGLQPSPIFGTGFESFWLGERLEKLWRQFGWLPTEAHNGYLEIYLHLGGAGLLLFGGLIIATFSKIRMELFRRFELGRFRLAFLIVILLYNCSEAGFVNVHNVYTMFFLIAVDYPTPRRLGSKRISDSVDGKAEEAAVCVSGAMKMAREFVQLPRTGAGPGFC
jgi:exopolysaccharide production protein ExoQ